MRRELEANNAGSIEDLNLHRRMSMVGRSQLKFILHFLFHSLPYINDGYLEFLERWSYQHKEQITYRSLNFEIEGN